MIGSKTVASAPVAYKLGTILPQQTFCVFEQTVEFFVLVPEQEVAVFDQTTQFIIPERQVAKFQQNVISAGTSPTDITNLPPIAYVNVNGILLSCDTPYDNIVINHNEDQQSTASMFITYPSGIEINIPTFHGKSIQILTPIDPTDAASELKPIFTGWVDRAKHDMSKQGIALDCTDLRDERLGRENPDLVKQLTNGLYSNMTQKEDAEGREYISELMKTVLGSIGYGLDGSFYYYSWGVAGKTVDYTFTDNSRIDYESIETEFLTRSDIRNTVNIQVQYRYYRRNKFFCNMEAKRPRIISNYGIDGYVTGYDLQTFTTDAMADRANSFDPWYTATYTVIPAKAVAISNQYSGDPNKPGVSETFSVLKGRAIGFTAFLSRNVAQPILQTYQLKIVAPQSVDAYKEEVDGGNYAYSLDVEFDIDVWERNNREFGADSKRDELNIGFNAAYLIGKKDIVSSHRRNYVSFDRLQKIDVVNIGDIVELNTSLIATTGQVAGIQYNLTYGEWRTSYKLAISYMDSDLPQPTEEWTTPNAPVVKGISRFLSANTGYVDGNLTADAPEIPEQYTNEIEPTEYVETYQLPLEINDITLINGY